jgi:hypothetical protein
MAKSRRKKVKKASVHKELEIEKLKSIIKSLKRRTKRPKRPFKLRIDRRSSGKSIRRD